MTGSLDRCVYCGSDKDLTDDHVPPKLLLMPPYPPNLLTVPACLPCNKSFQKDDEYTRTMLAIDVRASKNADAQSNLPAVFRSLQRPDARGFAEYLAKQADTSTILGQDGSPMGQVFDLDKERTNRTGERFVRALYFVETGTPVPSHAKVRIECKTDLRPTDADTITIARAMQTMPDWRDGRVGTAFSYMAAFGDGGSASAWLLLLYDFFYWVGIIDARPKTEADTPA
jgi:hypothetical protein